MGHNRQLRLLKVGYWGPVARRQGARIYCKQGHASTLCTRNPDCYDMTGGIRKPSRLEMVRMMGFPDSWKVADARVHYMRQLGNAVIPKMVGHVFRGFVRV